MKSILAILLFVLLSGCQMVTKEQAEHFYAYQKAIRSKTTSVYEISAPTAPWQKPLEPIRQNN